MRKLYNRDITGETYNYLTVLSYSHNGKGGSFWNVKCTCGNEKVLHIYQIKSGHTKSCGCRKHGGLLNKPGHKLSKETKEKISKSLLGRTLSEEHKLNIKNNYKVKRGKDCNFWKGGISSVNKTIREWKKYAEWRTKIYERDNYTCQLCSQVGGKLNADHIKPLAFVLKEQNINSLEQAESCNEIWNIANGRTLCIKCHKKTEK